MSKTIVFDVPATHGGALTILNMYYKKACFDSENDYIFVVSEPQLYETENIRVLRFPEIKKSWLRRLFFDKVTARKIVKQYQPDKILSLQNTFIGGADCIPQEIYMHQSLPFIDYKFILLREPKLWVYQNIIGRIIKRSLKKVDEITVQTQWVKSAILKKCKVEPNKIAVVSPQINKDEVINYNGDADTCFFYPATPITYKNHITILKALLVLKEKNVFPKFIFTFNGEENKNAIKLKSFAIKNDLNVEFCGSLTRQEVFLTYSKSTLVFPSFVETFGLPLLEARQAGCPIICAREAFSEEICGGYDKVSFFHRFDFVKLAELIMAQS